MAEWILILTMGLPRSGKSSWALSTGLPIVNRDAIRLALHGQPFILEAEDMVTVIETYMVKSLFLSGHTKVIIDATHLKEKYRKRWERGPWNVELKKFDTPKSICIERAKADGREDLIPIIQRISENIEWDNRNEQ